jgi:hypothetical protein
MGLQSVEERERPPKARPMRYLHRITETVSGPTGAVIVTGVSDSMTMRVVGYDWSSNATAGLTLSVTFFSGHSESANEYDPAMVEHLRRLDAAAPEAKFNNVVDMLEWLNRD